MHPVADAGEPTPSRLAIEMGELRGTVVAVDRKVDDLRTSMGKLTEAMTSVVRLEVQHQQVSLSLQSARDQQAALEKRVDAVERLMPGLVETRAWIVRWMLVVVGVVGTAVLALVVKAS